MAIAMLKAAVGIAMPVITDPNGSSIQNTDLGAGVEGDASLEIRLVGVITVRFSRGVIGWSFQQSRAKDKGPFVCKPVGLIDLKHRENCEEPGVWVKLSSHVLPARCWSE